MAEGKEKLSLEYRTTKEERKREARLMKVVSLAGYKVKEGMARECLIV